MEIEREKRVDESYNTEDAQSAKHSYEEKIIGQTRKQLIEYGKLLGKSFSETDSIRSIYLNISGKSFEQLEHERNKFKIIKKLNKVKLVDKYIYIDFSNVLFSKISVGDEFHYNAKGLHLEKDLQIKKDVLIFDVKVVELDGNKLIELKNISLLVSVVNNYFKIRKIGNFGKYYIIFKKIRLFKDLSKNEKQLTKWDLEKIESEKSIKRISQNLNDMVLNERAYELKEVNDSPIPPQRRTIPSYATTHKEITSSPKYFINEVTANKLGLNCEFSKPLK